LGPATVVVAEGDAFGAADVPVGGGSACGGPRELETTQPTTKAQTATSSPIANAPDVPILDSRLKYAIEPLSL
jgi:hypothetical protein